jgi:hypothetical protein
MKMKLIPFKKVGQFELGKSIELYKDKYNLVLEENYFEKYSTSLIYDFEESDTSLCIDGNHMTILSIMCDEELFYKGKNLIGMTIEEFIAHTCEKYVGEIDVLDFEDDEIPQNVYEFETLGLQVWEKGLGGKIVSITVCQKYEEEEENE